METETVTLTAEEFGLMVARISSLEGQVSGCRDGASEEASAWRFAARDVLRCIALHGIDHKYTDEALWHLADVLDGYDRELGEQTGYDYWKRGA